MYPIQKDRASGRRGFVQKSALGAVAFGIGFPRIAKATSKKGELSIESSATNLARAIKSGYLSSAELLQDYLARIAEVNPAINAVVATCPERALEEAKKADASIAAAKQTGPLHGVPFTIKDSLDTQGVVTTAGTLGYTCLLYTSDAADE